MTTWWNNADKDGDVSLSGGGVNAADMLVASATALGLTRSLGTIAVGNRVYFEAVVTAVNANDWYIGFANTSEAQNSYPSNSANSVAVGSSGNVSYNNVAVASIGSLVANDVVQCCAFRASSTILRVWFRKNNTGNWNGSPGADPATDIGGYSAGISGTILACFGGANTATQTATMRFSQASWGFTPPSGFNEIAYVQADPATSWNPNGTTSTVTLSNGNRTAKGNTGFTVGLGKSTLPVSGKVYFEARIDSFALSDSWIIGIVQSSAATNSDFGGGTRRVGVMVNSSGNVTVFNDGSVAATLGTAAAGQIVSIAFDADNNLFWGRLQNGNWNASGSADPAGGSGGFSTSLLTGERVVGFTTFTTSDQLTVAFHPSQWTKWAPVGFGPVFGTGTRSFRTFPDAAALVSSASFAAPFAAVSGVVTVTTGVTDPSGGTGAITAASNTGISLAAWQWGVIDSTSRTGFTNGQTYTVEVFCKGINWEYLRASIVAGSQYGQWFNLENGFASFTDSTGGTITDARSTHVGNDWYLFQFSFVSNGSNVTEVLFTGNTNVSATDFTINSFGFVGFGISLWRFQIYPGPPKSPFLATGATASFYRQPNAFTFWPNATAGGTVYNVSVAETITSIVDAITGLLTMPASMPESMATSDSQTGLAIFPRTVPETMASTDTQSAVGVFPRDVAETVSATTDTQTGVMVIPASMPESAGATDTPSATLTMPVSVPESMGASDTPSSALTAVGSVAESMSATDTPSSTALLNVSLAESVAITDAQTGLMVMAASVAESLAATDTLTGGLLFAVTVAESAGATDAQTGLLTMLCDRAEIMGVADSPNATAAFVLSVAETAGVSDSVTGLLTIAAAVAETVASADTPNSGNIFAVTTDESAAITDTASLQVTLVGSVAEAVSIADACNAQLVAVAAVVESASIVDAQSEDGPPPPGTDEYRVGGGGVKDIVQTLNVATIHHTQKKTGPS